MIRSLFVFYFILSCSMASALEVEGPFGVVKESHYHYFDRLNHYPTSTDRLDISVNASLSKADWNLKLEPWAWGQVPYELAANPREKKFFFEFREAWVEKLSENFDIRIGNQIVSWGKADRLNPTDVINPHDNYDLLHSEKLPVAAIKINFHPEENSNWDLEFIAVPEFRKPMLPVDQPTKATTEFDVSQSRWFIPVPSDASFSGVINPIQYEIANPIDPSEKWEAGAKLSLTDFKGWDFSLLSFYGVENLPRIALDITGDTTDPNIPTNVELYPSYHRHITTGFDGSRVFQFSKYSLGFRFEVAYTDRLNDFNKKILDSLKSDLIKDDFVHAVIGADTTLPGRILGSVLYINLQYVYYEYQGNREPDLSNQVSGLPVLTPWDRNIVLLIENRFTSKLSFRNMAIYSTENEDGMYSPSFQYSWSDSLSFNLAGEWFFGDDEEGFFGQFDKSSRAILNSKYIW